MMKQHIKERISAVRNKMAELKLDAYLVTGTDPHLSEYIPVNWLTREWLTGFTGSFGKVLVTVNQVLLWTDTRYFLQAIAELDGTDIILMKDRVPETISPADWLIQHLMPGSFVGVDGKTISETDAIVLEEKLRQNKISFTSAINLIDAVWIDRPTIPFCQAFLHPDHFAGKTRVEKINLLRKELKSGDDEVFVITRLDDLAWLLNLRGNDTLYTPLLLAFGYVDMHSVHLFTDLRKIPDQIKSILNKEGIQLNEYQDFDYFIDKISHKKVFLDHDNTNSAIVRKISGGTGNQIHAGLSYITRLKSIKDEFEIQGIRNACLKDGIAMVKALCWIDHHLGRQRITECSFGLKLNEFRSQQPDHISESFHPIVSFGAHGAIVHYHASPSTDVEIGDDNLLIIDSGGQYLDGTTDITRTIGFKNYTTEQQQDFTLGLKSHIALATAIFPEGTKGYSLDSITRKPMWDKGVNYGHGTGHGIGYFLAVHEGPMSIRSEANNEPMREGQVLSNEPGIYREGKYGIRTENMIHCIKYATTSFGNFLAFETLTLCPIDRKLILKEELSSFELSWLNHYHEMVFQSISPFLTENEEKHWLNEACAPI